MKPSLHEIANMPHSQAVMAMREHYDPQWPMVTAEPDEEVECDACGDLHPLGVMDGGYCPRCADLEDEDFEA